MNQTTPSPPADPPAPWLQWFVRIPLAFALFTILAMVTAVIVCLSARFFGHPVRNHLATVDGIELRFVRSVPSGHPVSYLASWVERIQIRIPPSLDVRTLPSTKDYVEDLPLVLRVVTRRGLIAFGLLAPLALVLLAAIQDGLYVRELRKFGGDPESAFVYRHAKSWITTSVGCSLITYLLFPLALHPQLVLCVLALVCGFATHLTISRFKKFL